MEEGEGGERNTMMDGMVCPSLPFSVFLLLTLSRSLAPFFLFLLPYFFFTSFFLSLFVSLFSLRSVTPSPLPFQSGHPSIVLFVAPHPFSPPLFPFPLSPQATIGGRTFFCSQSAVRLRKMSPPCSFPPASSSSENPSQNGQIMAQPLPTLEEIRAAVPKECFEKSLGRSLFYLVVDLVVIAALYVVVPFVETNFGLIGLFFWYCLLGMYLSSLFIVGHDCGHGTFSNWQWVNDIFGHLAHALLMVPFWPWQKSHRHHHQFTSHLDKDKGHPWVLEEHYEDAGWLRKHFAKIPLSGLVRWNPVYTIAGLPDGSHFWPFSRLFFNKTERIKCAISASLCLLSSWAIFSLLDHSPWAFFKYYYVPLMFQGYWMVIITYLQHQDEQIEVYEEGNWAFVKGQLQTYDREYGFGIDHAMHHITDGHVAHHFFFTRIPHYHLPEATKSIRKLLEKYPGAYKRKSNYDFLFQFLWMNFKLDCLVGKGSGLLKYRSTAWREERRKKGE